LDRDWQKTKKRTRDNSRKQQQEGVQGKLTDPVPGSKNEQRKKDKATRQRLNRQAKRKAKAEEKAKEKMNEKETKGEEQEGRREKGGGRRRKMRRDQKAGENEENEEDTEEESLLRLPGLESGNDVLHLAFVSAVAGAVGVAVASAVTLRRWSSPLFVEPMLG